MVFGSSHSWRGVDTYKMNEDYNLKSFNYSCMWQHLNTTLLFIDDAFRTQSPKLVVIDTGRVDSLLKDTDLVGEVYYI